MFLSRNFFLIFETSMAPVEAVPLAERTQKVIIGNAVCPFCHSYSCHSAPDALSTDALPSVCPLFFGSLLKLVISCTQSLPLIPCDLLDVDVILYP